MKRFQNILAVYNGASGSDSVLEHAMSLARRNHAALTLIDVMPERYSTQSELEEREKLLNRLVPSLVCEDVQNVSTRVARGSPFLVITRQVLRENHDLVIAGTEDEAAVMGLNFSGTATHLMRKCPCPVWVVKQHQPNEYFRILACVDPLGSSQNQLDKKILELAASLATLHGAQLNIANAWDVEGKDRDSLKSEIQDYTRDAILMKHEKVHRERVESLIEDLSERPEEYNIHLARGAPQQEIIGLVRKLEIDLTVMGTVSRTGRDC